MRITDAEASYSRFLDARGLAISAASTAELVAAMIDWYEIERADDAVAIRDDGDQLLFQWATVSQASRPTFGVSLARQLIEAGGESASI